MGGWGTCALVTKLPLKKVWIIGLYSSWISDLSYRSGYLLPETCTAVKSTIQDQRNHQTVCVGTTTLGALCCMYVVHSGVVKTDTTRLGI